MIKLKVLLVDDDEVNNYLNKALLKGLEFVENVEVVTDGKQGLEYLNNTCKEPENQCPELVIFDHHMPVMDGLEMIRELNAVDFRQKNETVFLLLGINTIQFDIDVFAEHGVSEFTKKPLSEKTVQEIYHKYWSNSSPEHPN